MLTVETLTVTRGGRTVLRDVNLTLAPGRTLAVLGQSGAGKSTLVASVLGLLRPDHGQVRWNGAPLPRGAAALVMQEPRAAFNPRLTLRRSVQEPLRARRLPDDPVRLARLCRGLELPPESLDRLPGQVSIGQAQRAGVLRALIAAPPLILFDEPLSALDAMTQKHTARMISELQREEGFAALVVTHDLGYAAAHADAIAVLRAGQIEETAETATFFAAPQSAYGRSLVEAAVSLGALGRQTAA
ncbi:peptide/nickel transport system ATP-binding protein [Pseudooceanicola antarcticus]|uniref:ABC transporter ATP-binding protein n=1 Tax=Pseudooceanicola antarcticus TaxID=1247613 RepID=A0A285J7V4_9RHOB|nr:ATP-binding cassette domain-containing protein [Pseudooceanicola antarcticus]PJE27083.1 ABC transporter ATP-binding protein [Pseudooceanicola antarcticus]SNY56420.1 peptide/nickel transport system ATP-binding protein [Pseudooceanicola antarcticus]